ncbi:MAG TPA: hypothetical protein VI172_15995 [Candidatus Dormibacteraeota bacterium]|jgi:hypothetical protein
MATRYALEFRSGSYFVNVDRSTGGALHEAATFITEDNATWWFNKFAPWVWQNGGMLVSVEVPS